MIVGMLIQIVAEFVVIVMVFCAIIGVVVFAGTLIIIFINCLIEWAGEKINKKRD